jgi:hypothetical protein
MQTSKDKACNGDFVAHKSPKSNFANSIAWLWIQVNSSQHQRSLGSAVFALQLKHLNLSCKAESSGALLELETPTISQQPSSSIIEVDGEGLNLPLVPALAGTSKVNQPHLGVLVTLLLRLCSLSMRPGCCLNTVCGELRCWSQW